MVSTGRPILTPFIRNRRFRVNEVLGKKTLKIERARSGSMQQQEKISVAKRHARGNAAILILLLIVLIILGGCTSLGTKDRQVSAPKESNKPAKAKTPVEVFPHLKEVLKNTNTIQIFERQNLADGNKDAGALKKTFKSGEPEFRVIKAAFFKELVHGEVATKSLAESKLVFLKGQEIIYEINYCAADGRVEDSRIINGSQTFFFMPSDARELLE